MFDSKDTAVLMYKAATCCTYIYHNLLGMVFGEVNVMKIVNGTRASSATGL